MIFGADGVTWYPFGYGHYVEHLRKKQEYGWAGADAVAVENTRLIDGLKEVPEKTRMQSARFSTEQSYTDWQLTLAGEQLTKAAAALSVFWKSRCRTRWMENRTRRKAPPEHQNRPQPWKRRRDARPPWKRCRNMHPPWKSLQPGCRPAAAGRKNMIDYSKRTRKPACSGTKNGRNMRKPLRGMGICKGGNSYLLRQTMT